MLRRGHAGRVDANHTAVIKALRQLGWVVMPTGTVGGGCPDAFAAKNGRVVPIEIKDGSKRPSARKLTEDEQKVHAQFAAAGVQVVVIERVEDCARV